MSANTHTQSHVHRRVGGRGGYPLFRLFGFEVKLDLSWLLLALLITWTLAAGLFPSDYPGLARETYWWMGVAGAVGIFFSIVFHEFSHSIVARAFGMPITGITLFIFGGVAEMEDEAPTPRSEFLMALAGPIASLILAFIFYQANNFATAADWPASVLGVTYYLALANLMLAVFNIVPAFPLDGGRMLRAALWGWTNNLRRATHIASMIGSGFGIVLIILGVLTFIQGNFIGGMWWFLIGAFLRGVAAASYRQTVVRETLKGTSVRRFMSSDPVTVSPSMSLQQLVDDYMYKHYYKMLPVVDGSRLVGCITSDDVKQVPRDEWSRRSVSDLVQPCTSSNCVSPNADAAKVLTSMTRPNADTRLMVVENDKLLGVVSLKDLRQFIALKLELESTDD